MEIFIHKNICCSNKYSQHMFTWRNKKNIETFGEKKQQKKTN